MGREGTYRIRRIRKASDKKGKPWEKDRRGCAQCASHDVGTGLDGYRIVTGGRVVPRFRVWLKQG
jgi:hypothetical protein